MRRLATIVLLLAVPAVVPAQTEDAAMARARRFLASRPIIDGHNDPLGRFAITRSRNGRQQVPSGQPPPADRFADWRSAVRAHLVGILPGGIPISGMRGTTGAVDIARRLITIVLSSSSRWVR